MQATENRETTTLGTGGLRIQDYKNKYTDRIVQYKRFSLQIAINTLHEEGKKGEQLLNKRGSREIIVQNEGGVCMTGDEDN